MSWYNHPKYIGLNNIPGWQKKRAAAVVVPDPSSIYFNEDSTDEYMDIEGFGAALSTLGAGSVSAWVYITNLAAVNTVLSTTNQGTNSKLGVEILANGTLNTRVQPADGQTEVARGTNSGTAQMLVTADAWYHCVWCINLAGDDIDHYINGLKVVNTEPSWVQTSWSNEETASRIGQKYDGTLPTRGKIHQISFWDKFLDQTDVTELYNGGPPLDETTHTSVANLVNLWKMDTTPTVADQVGDIDGTLTNTDEADLVEEVPQVVGYTIRQPVNNDSFGSFGQLNARMAQGITPPQNCEITTIRTNFGISSGSPTGNVFVEIVADTGGDPDEGTVLATSNNVDITTASAVDTQLTFTFATPAALTANTQYHFIVNLSTITFNSGFIDCRTASTAPYAGGQFKWSGNAGSTWNAVAEDMVFEFDLELT